MLTRLSNNAGNSSAEEKFVQLFCDVFGAEKGQYVYLQYPFVDIYGKHRTIDFAIKTEADKIAFEIDGETWHNPTKVSKDKYIDDLLKQNSIIVYLRKPTIDLEKDGQLLSEKYNLEALRAMARQRKPYYRQWSDIKCAFNIDPQRLLKEITEYIKEKPL